MGHFLPKSFPLFLYLVFLEVSALAQLNSINVIQPPYNGVCGGTKILLPVAINGTYNADNTFTVQLIGGSVSAPTYLDLPTKGNGNPLEIILPDTIRPAAYRLRVLASSPKTTGIASTYFYPQRKPTALIAERPLTIEPYGSVAIPIQLSGSDITAYSPYRVTINDSLFLNSNYASSFVAYPGNKTTTYKVTKVENGCGEGTASGKQTVTVAPFGLQLTTISPEVACPGSTIKVNFSANGTFESGNRFTVQVTNEKGEYVDLPTQGDRSPLEVRLPSNVPDGWGNYVRIVSTAPALVSNSIGGMYNYRALSLYPAPTATLETEVKAMPFGQSATLVVRLNGHNTQCILSDGTRLEHNGSDRYQPEPGRYDVIVRPSESTTYTIRSATGACGPVDVSGTVRVEVTNGIIAGKLADDRPCIGQTIRIPIQTNAALTAQTTFQVQIGETIKLPAILLKDTVVATLTSSALGISPGLDGSYYTGSNSIKVITQNPSMVSTISPSSFEVGYLPLLANIGVYKSRSDGSWDWIYNPILEKPEPIQVIADAKSNLPMIIRLTDGLQEWMLPTPVPRYSGEYPWVVLGAFPLQTTTYSILDITNKCGTRSMTGKSKQVTIQKAGTEQVLVSNLPDRIFCEGEPVSIPFHLAGTVNDTIRYRAILQAYNQFRTKLEKPIIAGRSLKSPVDVVLPTVPGADMYSIRIEAENAAIDSREIFLKIHKKPSATILPSTTELLPGESTTLLVEAKGGGPYVVTTAEGSLYTIQANTDSERALISVKPDQTTTYRMKSVANKCGTTAFVDERTIKVVPYRLYITNPSNPGSYATTTLDQKSGTCRGGLLTVPYATIGNVPSDENFELQVARGSDSQFETIPLQSTGNPLIGRLPDSYTADLYGTYKVRVVGRRTGTISQTIASFRVGDIPKAVLSSTSQLIADPVAQFLVSVTNGDNFTTYGIRNYEPDYAGKYAHTVSAPNGTLYNVLPRQKTTYSLAFVRNACGYGTVSGEATITVKPTLSIISPTPNVQLLTCAGKPLDVTYQTTGDWPNGISIAVELVGPGMNSKRILTQATARQGTVSLTIPTDLTSGDYTIVLRSTNPEQTASIPIRIGVPVAAQLTGNLTINAGQKLVLKPVIAGTFPINYTLSDGAVGVWQTAPASIELSPNQNSTYSVVSVSNICGAGSVSGVVSISVNPAGAKTLTTDRISGRICGGDTIQVDYTGKGLDNSPLVVQLSDRLGVAYTSLPTLGQASPLRAILPSGLPSGENYRFRVVSTDPTVASSVILTPVTIREKATASIAGPPYFTLDKPANLTVTVTGSMPVSLTLGPDGSTPWIWQIVQAETIISLSPNVLPTTFRLIRAQNGCGAAQIQGEGVVRLELLTALEPNGLALQVFPNPASQTVFIDNLPALKETVSVDLLSVDGKMIRTAMYPPTKLISLPIADLPHGIYILRINVGQATVTYRLIKS